jgi:hypothetical protein
LVDATVERNDLMLCPWFITFPQLPTKRTVRCAYQSRFAPPVLLQRSHGFDVRGEPLVAMGFPPMYNLRPIRLNTGKRRRGFTRNGL